LENTYSYEIFFAILTSPTASKPLLGNTVDRALNLVGPTTVFGDINRFIEQHRYVESDLHNIVSQFASQRQVWIDHSIFIEHADIPASDAKEILATISDRVNKGEPFDSAYAEARKKHAYADVEKSHLTPIGNLGYWILNKNHLAPKGFGTRGLLQEHALVLLEAKPNELIILDGTFESGQSATFLYSVKDVYQPNP